MRDTDYATEMVSVDHLHCRIEKLWVKREEQVEIRFSWWPDGKMANRPLDLPEHELLPLMEKAIEANVFSSEFLNRLHSLLSARPEVRNA